MIELTEILERDPPFGAEVKFEAHPPADGFRAPPLPPNVAEELERVIQFSDRKTPIQLGSGNDPIHGYDAIKVP